MFIALYFLLRYISLGGCYSSTLRTTDMLCTAILLISLLKDTWNKYAIVLKKISDTSYYLNF